MSNKLCECGCGATVRENQRFVSGHNSKVAHPMQGRKHSAAAKREMSNVKKSRVKQNQQSHPDGPPCACGCGGRAKPGNRYIYTHHRKGTPLSEAHKKAIGRGSEMAWQNPDSLLNSEEYRRKLSEAMKRREVTWGDKVAETMRGRTLPIEARRNMSLAHGGDGSLAYTKRSRPGWKRLVKEIRKRDDYTCQECGAVKPKGAHRQHHVHHVNYNLDDLRPENLITLCRSCHGKTNVDREHWIERYTTKLALRGIC